MTKRLRIFDNDLKYLVFSEIYQRFSEPKAQRKAFDILECAIQCIAKHGFESVTAAIIARKAGVSRTLLLHYFSDLKELLQTSLKFVRLLFQKLAVSEINRSTDPIKMIELYVRSCFIWVEGSRIHALVWLHFLLECAHKPALRELNTAATAAGGDRIVALIENGVSAGKFSVKDPAQTAKLIQTIITGALVTIVSEKIENQKKFEDSVLESCRALLAPVEN